MVGTQATQSLTQAEKAAATVSKDELERKVFHRNMFPDIISFT